jgi:hypothetical protein
MPSHSAFFGLGIYRTLFLLSLSLSLSLSLFVRVVLFPPFYQVFFFLFSFLVVSF